MPAGERVYAVGDIHGRRDLLVEIERLIADDLRRHPARGHVHRIFLGDYVDRGPESRGVVEHLCRAARAHDPPTFLLGNHDWWFRQFVDGAGAARGWLGSGAEATLASYGVRLMPAVDDAAGWARARIALLRRMPGEHRRLLQTLQTQARHGDYLFAHAGIRPGVPPDRQDPMDLLFIREPFLSQPDDLDVVVVHGHTVVEAPQVRPHRVGIDTGAYGTGCLTAAVLEEDKLRFLQTEG